MTLRVATAPINGARSGHWVVPNGMTSPIRTLLLEPQRTNLCIRSEEFNDAAWNKGGGITVTANAETAPDGTVTADRLVADGSVAFQNVNVNVAFTGDGDKCAAVYLKAGTSAASRVEIRDVTANVARARILVTWTAGVPSLSVEDGTGTVFPVEAIGNGWYRVMFRAAGIVAANTNSIRIYPTTFNTATAGNVLAWGAQVENAFTPSSYIPTAGTTATRGADSLYWTIPALNPPRPMTIYVRGVSFGAGESTDGRFVYIGSAAGGNPRLFFRGTGTSNRLQVQRVDGSGNNTFATALVSVPFGSMVDARAVLFPGGGLFFGVAVGSGSEEIAGPNAGAQFESGWSDTRLYIGPAPVGNGVPFAFANVVVAEGNVSLPALRRIGAVYP